jgi:hypothetical protein
MPLVRAAGQDSTNFDRFASSAFKGTPYHLISIGDPAERFPSPGSVKLYPVDEAWKPLVSKLIMECPFILIRCLDTPGFKWELDTIAQQRCHTKLFIYIGLEEHEAVVWSHAIGVLRDAGFSLPEEFPGNGTLIGFDANAQAVRCAAHVGTGRAFAEAVVTQLSPRAELVATEEQQPGWNQASPSHPGTEEEFYSVLWRKQFLRNPFRLGPPGILMLLIWLGASALLVYAMFQHQTRAVQIRYETTGEYGSGGGRGAAILIATLWFGFLWILLFSASDSLSQWTIQWAEKRAKSLNRVFGLEPEET